MDGVVHPNVEQAIGRDRIRKALKRYENRPADEHRYGIVRAVNEDGSYEVLLDGDVQTSRCAQYGTALVGDRVLAVTKKDGRNDLIGRLGGEIGGGGTVVTKVDDVSNYVAGRVFAHAGTNDPAGALLCDGRAVSRREYWELFDAIGTTYGAGDGSSTFNLPNIESRTIIGESDSYALGATGGEEEHTLTEAELPYLRGRAWFRNWTWGGGSQGSVFLSPDGIMEAEPGGTTGYDMLSYGSAQGGSNILKVEFGGDQPHNNMQPYIVMRYFITTGKGDPVSGINPADYVVEWGQTNGWHWEKYASGKAECWAVLFDENNEPYTTWNNMPFRYTPTWEFPIEFIDVPSVSYAGYIGSGFAIDARAEATKDWVRLFFATSATGSQRVEAHIQAKGKWKDSPASGGTETIAPTIAEKFEGIEADILDMRTNKVLCATAAWMYASETMTLSEPISAQENGVVLVFSFHDGNTTQDSNWVHVPILKEFVARHSGQGTLVNMRGLTNENKGNKYLYITDTTIKGHDSNAAEGMSSDGTVYKNQRYLLRYVIGF